MIEMTKRYNIGVDIGGTKTAIVLITEQGNVQDSSIFKTIHRNAEEQIKQIRVSIAAICESNRLQFSDLISIGIGIPGTVDNKNKTVIFAPNIGWRKIDITGVVAAEENVSIYLAQDTHAAAVGEFMAGAGVGCNNVICITVGTGIGAGLILNGKLYKGSINAAGELGHIMCKTNGEICKCGKSGCLETCVSGTALNKKSREKGFRGAKDLFMKAEGGNLIAKEIIGESVEYLGTALVNVANLLSPDAIIISGGLCEQALFVEGVRNYVKKNTYSITANHMRIEKALLGSLAPAIGAAMLYKVMQ